jgi:hypothetical protein
MARLYGPGPADPPPLVSTTDLAGLRTTDVEDRPVGALFGTLSEQATGMIRYLDVALDGTDRHVLVPIGHSRIDTEAVPPRVRLRAATYEDLLAVPEYDPAAPPVDPDYHARLLEAYGQVFYGARYYAHPAFDHSALYAGPTPIVVGDPGVREPVSPVPESPAERDRAVRPLSALAGYRFEGRDLRDRQVEDGRGERVGEVVDVLVDPPRREARYAVIQIQDLGRPTALPIGYLEPADDGDGLVARFLTRDDIRVLPPYENGLTREDENRIQLAIEGRLAGDRYFQRVDFRRG